MAPALLIGIITTSVTVSGLLVKLISWVFNAAVNKVVDPIEKRLARVEDRQGLLWSIAEQRAMETLHHSDQPAFDYLIEQFKVHTMNPQELTQFIERLTVLSSDLTKPGQVPAARVLLESAKAELHTRFGLDPPLSPQEHAATLVENILARRTMANEASNATDVKPGTKRPPVAEVAQRPPAPAPTPAPGDSVAKRTNAVKDAITLTLEPAGMTILPGETRTAELEITRDSAAETKKKQLEKQQEEVKK